MKKGRRPRPHSGLLWTVYLLIASPMACGASRQNVAWPPSAPTRDPVAARFDTAWEAVPTSIVGDGAGRLEIARPGAETRRVMEKRQRDAERLLRQGFGAAGQNEAVSANALTVEEQAGGPEVLAEWLVAQAERVGASPERAVIEGEALPAVVPRTDSAKRARKPHAPKGTRQRRLVDLLKVKDSMTADEYRERRLEILLKE
jgi:hypothetical protein